ncbi:MULTISPECIES: L,D-transpeptidase [Bacillus]|uniref:L,D-transpeptidase n=1 Tax=Bacillus TaxID=1386 RepID=UPI0002EA6318|nr:MULTISPECIES: L,D-transpeptidase [Bacillus]
MRTLLSLFLIFALSMPNIVNAAPVKTEPFLIVNKANNKLAYIKDGKVVEIFNVATGRSNELTPEGLFTIVVKAKNPYYRKKNIPGGDPRNPLGSRWLGFDANGTDGRTFGVHGTNEPWSIGKYISNGCIRMKNSDVERLYEQVPLKTKILVTLSSKSFAQIAKENGYLY